MKSEKQKPKNSDFIFTCLFSLTLQEDTKVQIQTTGWLADSDCIDGSLEKGDFCIETQAYTLHTF